MTTSRPDSVLFSRPNSVLFSRPTSSILVSRPPSASFLPRPPSTSTKRRPTSSLRFRKTLSSKCSICSEEFRYKDALPCFQNFCTQCLEDHVLTFKRGTGCNCPLCKSGLLLPKSKSRTRSAKYSSKSAPLMCDVCEQVRPAKFRCVECDDYYCEKCNKDFLRRMRIDNNFNVTDISDLTADESLIDLTLKELTHNETQEEHAIPLPPGVGTMCKRHAKEELRFFCTECEIPICRDCKILAHEGHPCRPLENVREERKAHLTDAVKLGNKNVRKLHAEVAEMNSKRVDIEQETRDVEQQILNHVTQLKKLIDELAEHMMKVVHAQNNESRGMLHKCRDAAKDKIKILQDMINGATKVLESDNAVELVNNSPEIIQQLNDADSSYTADKLWRKRYVFDPLELDDSSVKKLVGNLRCLSEGMLKPLPAVDLEMQSTFNCDQSYKHTSAIAPLSDGTIWVCNGFKNRIQRFDICGIILETEILSFDVDDMAIGNDGSLYLTELNGKVIRKVSKFTPITVFARSDVYLRGICMSADGDQIIACGNDVPVACMREARLSKIIFYNLSGRQQREIPLYLGSTLYRICHTVNEEIIVSTGISGKYLVVLDSGKVKYTYQASSTADGVASDKHGLVYLSSCNDDTLYILDYQGNPLPSTYAMHRPNAVAIDNNETVWVGDWSKIHVLHFKD